MSNPTMPKGNYRVLPTSLRLVVEDTSAYLVFQIAGSLRAYFSIPMEGVAEVTEDTIDALAARGKVAQYLGAAYVERDTPSQWMTVMETGDGPAVWLRHFWDEHSDDVDRAAVSGGYESWLTDQ